MRRLAEFVVKGRVPIFVISILLAVVSALAMTQVTIERDPATFLPVDSMTRKGLDVMATEFEESSVLEVMFSDLDEAQIDDVAQDLEDLPHVLATTWETGEPGTAAHGKVLYTVTLEGNAYSLEAEAGVKEIQEYAKDMDVALAGTPLDTMNQLSTLGLNIVMAVAILLAILFIMCSSWIEPLLFLLVIGIAVLYNMGTNALLPSIGIMTFAVAAVLQLALSMDYSIMLTDRYRQERLLTNDKEPAMVNALKGGFTAISSSSLTTIAGMLCLVAMSFAIGRDMGVVLGKGVAFSVLSVLLILPGVMVMFDGAIQKTRKPHPRPQLKALARFSHSFRYVILFVAAALIAFSFWAKSSAGVAFFMNYDSDDRRAIQEAFPATEQIVLLYKSNEATPVALEDIEALEGISSLQSYETSLGKPYTADELAQEMGLDPLAAQLMFYVHDYGTVTGTLGMNDFATFIESTVASNPQFSDTLGTGVFDQIGTLKNLSDPAYITQQLTAAQAADALGIDVEQAQQLYMLYAMQSGAVDPGTMTPAAFVAFVREAAATNAQFSAMFDEAALAQLGTLATLTDVAAVTTPLPVDQMALALGMDASLVDQVYRYNLLVSTDISWYVLTIQQVLGILVDEIAVNPLYAASFDEATLARLATMRAVAENSAWAVALTPDQVVEMLGFDAALVQFVFEYTGTLWGVETPATLTVDTILNVLLDGVAYNAEVLSWLDPVVAADLQAQAPQLEQLRGVANMAAQWMALNADTMAASMGMDAGLMYQVYLSAMLADGSLVMPLMTVQQFLSFVIDGMVPSPQFAGLVDEATLAGLYQARSIIDATIAGTSYDALGLSQLLGVDYNQVAQVMAYRAYMLNGPVDQTLDLVTLVPFLVQASTPAGDAAAPDPNQTPASDTPGGTELAELTLLQKVVEGAQAGTTYTALEMTELLYPASPQITLADVRLLYLLEAATNGANPAQPMTLEEFATYAADEFVTDPLFASVVTEEQRLELVDSKQLLVDAKDQLMGSTYTRAILESSLPRESQEMQDLIDDIKDVMGSSGASYYLLGDAAMAAEMRASFWDEFNFITLLTAGVIFVIVLLTFRSFFVPLLLVAFIQAAINLTMGITVLQGTDTYYVALMVVQALLMGATIDYAILYTTSYREMRQMCGPREAIARALHTSIGTIMTSSSILILVTFAVGMTSADVTIAEVCLTISKGSLVAVMLVVLLLPGTLAALDPLVAGPRRLHGTEVVLDEPPTPPAGPTGPTPAANNALPKAPAREERQSDLNVLASIGVNVDSTANWSAAPKTAVRGNVQGMTAVPTAGSSVPRPEQQAVDALRGSEGASAGETPVAPAARATGYEQPGAYVEPARRTAQFTPRRPSAHDDFSSMDAFLSQASAAPVRPVRPAATPAAAPVQPARPVQPVQPAPAATPVQPAQPVQSTVAPAAAPAEVRQSAAPQPVAPTAGESYDDALWAELLRLGVPGVSKKPTDSAE